MNEYVIRVEVLIKADDVDNACLQAKELGTEVFRKHQVHGIYIRPLFGKNEWVAWEC